MIRILVTGSRDWSSWTAVDHALSTARWKLTEDGALTVVHGDCPTGADHFAKLWTQMTSGVSEETHRADWDRHGKAAGPIRNQHMVDRGADLCIAFLLPQSRGTRDCMRRARTAGIPIMIGGEVSMINNKEQP